MFKKLSYYLFILSTTSRLFPYLLIIGLTSFVVIIGMNAYFFGLFSAEALKAEGVDNVFGAGFVDTLWWSFKHLLDPGAFSENYGAPFFVILFALFNFSLCYYLTYWGTKFVFSNLGAILWGLLPLCVAFMAHFYLPDDKLTKKKSAGMSVGLIGTVLLFYNKDVLGQGQTSLGILAILLSVVLAAWPNVHLKMQKSKINPYHLNAVGMSASGLIFFILALVFETHISVPVDNKNIFAIFFLTVPGTVITWGIYIWLFNNFKKRI